MIKIFTDQTYLIHKNKGNFFPLFDKMVFDLNSQLYGYFNFTDNIKECNVLILPLSIDFFLENKGKKIVDYFKQLSKKHQKPLWVFSSGDVGLTILDPFIFVFRVADFESKKRKNSIIMPAFIEDPITNYENSVLKFLNKTEKPTIGYVGHAKGGLKKYVKLYLIYLKYNTEVFFKKIHSDYFQLYSSSHVRLKYLKILQKSSFIQTNFICRDQYRAGVKNNQDREKTTVAFFENIKNSHYTFCMRGGGNFSVRLFETLAMGRIPLQINTDCTLPLQDFLDWNSHCVIVDEKDINVADIKILEFQAHYSDYEFIELQKRNRIFWQENLTRDKYFSIIHDLFLLKKLGSINSVD